MKYVNIHIFSQLTWLSQTNCGWWRKTTYTFEFSVKSSIRIRYFTSCAKKKKLNFVDQCNWWRWTRGSPLTRPYFVSSIVHFRLRRRLLCGFSSVSMSGFVWARKVVWCAAVRSWYTVRTSGKRFLLQILLLAQHVSGTTMPIIRSSRILYSGCCLWHFVLWFSSCWSDVELRVMCSVCTY